MNTTLKAFYIFIGAIIAPVVFLMPEISPPLAILSGTTFIIGGVATKVLIPG